MTDASQQNWQVQMLAAMQAAFGGVPVSANNVANLNAWNACEGNASGGSGLPINNPFNTTLGSGNAPSVNSAGVKHYPDLQTGITATVDTLRAPRYAAVIAALKADAPLKVFGAAVGASGWGTSGVCIGGSSGAPAIPQDVAHGATGSGAGDAGAAVPASPFPIPNISLLGGLISTITSGAWWLRIGQGFAGAVMLLAGLFFILAESKAGQTIGRSVPV